MKESNTPSAQAYYEKRAKEGYGLQYPDGHVIRLYQHVLKEQFSKLDHTAKVFDFGCWNGTHAQYFARHGLNVAGADIIDTSVAEAKGRLPNSDIRTINDKTNLPEVFGENFDFIFANQVLYFLDDAVLKKRLEEFIRMLAPGGLFFASMISRNCFYSKHSTGHSKNGLETVCFSEPKRLEGKSVHIRFIENEPHLRELFSMFKCVQIGNYECDLDLAHSTEHFMFLGQRP